MVNYLKKQLFISSCVYIGNMMVGFGSTWSAPIIPKLLDPEQTPLPEVISDTEAYWVGSLLYLGTLIGPYLTGYLSNVKGRRPCLALGGGTVLVSFLLLAFAKNIIMIYVGRILVGAGLSIIAIMNMVYIGEIASTNIRGILLTMTAIFVALGVLLVYSVGPYVSYAWTCWLGVALSALYIIGTFIIPETPVFLALTGNMMMGFGSTWSAPIISKLLDPEQTPLPEVISDTEAYWVGSLLYLGTLIGPYLTWYLSNVKGRRPCLALGGGTVLVSFLLLAFAKNIIMIYVGRILVGAGLSIIAIMNMVYIGEIASTNIRGILLTMTAIFVALGVLLVYSVGPYVSYAWTCWLGVALSALYIIGTFIIPETPVFLALTGDKERAKATLISLGRPNDVDVVIDAKHNTEDSNTNWMMIFTVKTNRKALFITLTLNILQQMSGFAAVMFFVTTIFEVAGSSIESNIATIIIGVTQLVANSIAPFFVERNGRRSLLLFSTAASCLGLAVLGLYFFLDEVEHSVTESIKWLPLVSLIFFFLSFGPGYGIIPATLLGEMFTPNVRSSGSIFVMTVAYMVAFGVSVAFGYMLPALGGAITFWMFSGVCLFTFVFTIFFVPETKGKSLSEILEMLSK